jgi:hypothetical protein
VQEWHGRGGFLILYVASVEAGSKVQSYCVAGMCRRGVGDHRRRQPRAFLDSFLSTPDEGALQERREKEEEEFIASGNWRGKHNSLSRGAGAWGRGGLTGSFIKSKL